MDKSSGQDGGMVKASHPTMKKNKTTEFQPFFGFLCHGITLKEIDKWELIWTEFDSVTNEYFGRIIVPQIKHPFKRIMRHHKNLRLKELDIARN